MAPWADALYMCDWALWNKYHDTSDVDGGPSWTECPGLKISQDAEAVRLFPEIKRVPSVGGDPDRDTPAPLGLSLDPHRIHRGANSGYQALNLAVLMGARRIILLGYDMQISGKRHWHGDHVSGLNNPEPDTVAQWRRNYETTLPDLARAGVQVINATRDTALDCFPRAALESLC